MCFASYLIKDMGTKLDTFTKRYLEGNKPNNVTISLSPEKYNRFLKADDEKEATGSMEVKLTNTNLCSLLEEYITGIRQIYKECCNNIHPTKEQIRHYIKSTGYIGDKMKYEEATVSPDEAEKYDGWILVINIATLTLLEKWLRCYHHIPFNPEANGTDIIAQMVQEEIPLQKQSPEEIIEGFEKMIASTTDDRLKEVLQMGIEAQKKKLN